MTDDKHFNFTLPKQPEGRRWTAEEAERFLLEKLEKAGENNEEALLELAYFYSIAGREQTSMQYLKRLISTSDDPEKHAL